MVTSIARVGEARYPLQGEGSPEVDYKFPKFKANENGVGEMFINSRQRFTGAPEVSRNFWIGGLPSCAEVVERPTRAPTIDRRSYPLSKHLEDPFGNRPHHANHRDGFLLAKDRVSDSENLNMPSLQ